MKKSPFPRDNRNAYGSMCLTGRYKNSFLTRFIQLPITLVVTLVIQRNKYYVFIQHLSDAVVLKFLLFTQSITLSVIRDIHVFLFFKSQYVSEMYHMSRIIQYYKLPNKDYYFDKDKILCNSIVIPGHLAGCELGTSSLVLLNFFFLCAPAIR